MPKARSVPAPVVDAPVARPKARSSKARKQESIVEVQSVVATEPAEVVDPNLSPRLQWAAKFKQVRAQKGATQKAVADAMGVSLQSVQAIEKKGRIPSDEMIGAASSFLGVDLTSMLPQLEPGQTRRGRKSGGRPSTKTVDPNTVSGRVRLARENAGISQAELGRRAEMPTPAVWKIESGYTPKFETTVKLARALGCDPSDIDPRLAPGLDSGKPNIQVVLDKHSRWAPLGDSSSRFFTEAGIKNPISGRDITQLFAKAAEEGVAVIVRSDIAPVDAESEKG